MDRKAIKNLCSWYEQTGRKPLIIRGARQVGKTWLVRLFAKQLNLDLLELNFERDPKLKSLFQDNDPNKVLAHIEALFNKNILPKQSLLFLDEIQTAPELLAKLRWFAEEVPDLAVIATGSLLDFILEEHEFSMPVGRIQYLHLEPMSFEEFLLALGEQKLCDFLNSYEIKNQIPEAIHDQLWKYLREYVFVGGLPSAVDNWRQNRSFLNISEVHQNLLATYRDDFAKYAKKSAHDRLEEVFRAIPRLLGKKVKYSAINKDLPSTILKNALNLLCKARICHKVYASSGNGIPLEASIKEHVFKIIFLDVGLVSAACGITLPERMKFDELRLVNEGGIAEQLTGQLLRTIFPYFVEPKLYYWISEKAGAGAEIDYLIQDNTRIIPLEVKSGSTGTLRSLHNFMKLKNCQLALRINADYPSIVDVNVKDHTGEPINYKLLSLPAYLVEQVPRLMKLIQ
ncbi:MAG: AAA family ATPase [Gammaproteobacteria bacterium]